MVPIPLRTVWQTVFFKDSHKIISGSGSLTLLLPLQGWKTISLSTPLNSQSPVAALTQGIWKLHHVTSRHIPKCSFPVCWNPAVLCDYSQIIMLWKVSSHVERPGKMRHPVERERERGPGQYFKEPSWMTSPTRFQMIPEPVTVHSWMRDPEREMPSWAHSTAEPWNIIINCCFKPLRFGGGIAHCISGCLEHIGNLPVWVSLKVEQIW